jgi:hypothetical protein
MIRALIATSMLATGSAASAELPLAQSRVEIVGEAMPACVLRGDGKAQGSNMSFQTSGASAGEIRIQQLVDPTNSVPRAANVNLRLPIICNGPHKLVLRSGRGGLARDGAQNGVSAGPFREQLPYELSAVWDGREYRQLSNTGNDFVIDSGNGRAEDLALSIHVRGGGAPLVSGSYSDTITVQLQAAN